MCKSDCLAEPLFSVNYLSLNQTLSDVIYLNTYNSFIISDLLQPVIPAIVTTKNLDITYNSSFDYSSHISNIISSGIFYIHNIHNN